MTPTLRLLRLAGLVLLLGLLASGWSRFVLVWRIVAGGLVLVAVIDAFLFLLFRRLRVERRLPGRFALGVAQEVAVTLHNPNNFPLAALLLLQVA